MMSNIDKKVHINSLFPKPGITIWYCKIHQIIQSVFSNANYHSFQAMVNKLFKKDDFKTAFLNTRELEVANGFKTLKKQTEWLCGRYLLKQMFSTLVDPGFALENITIGYKEEGAPFFNNMPDLPISLSHSFEYTAAAIHEAKTKTIGLDIEKIQVDVSEHFLTTAFTSNELAQMGNDPEKIFQNWTIKEAYLKYIQKGFNESLHKVEVINNTIYHHQKPMDLNIYSRVIEGAYALSLVFD